MALTIAFMILITSCSAGNPLKSLPPLQLKQEWADKAKAKQEEYKKVGYDYRLWLQDYTTTGEYMTYGLNKSYTYQDSDTMKLDENGVPKVKYGDDFHYNPVTTAQYALSMHGLYKRGDEKHKEKFLKAADFLMTLADDVGAYRNQFKYKYNATGIDFEPGWVSGLAQGQVLSVYARAYDLTKDKKYIEAGDKAFKVLITPKEKGGTLSTLADLSPDFKDYIFFDEYPNTPTTYTLNGSMWAALGVYDWSNTETKQKKTAGEYFDKYIQSLKLLIPYYDLGGFPVYDLSYLTLKTDPPFNVTYHVFHVGLTHAIYTITRDPYFDYISRVWASYVNQ